MLTQILLTLFLVALNGFFVAAEFAIVKVRASQLQVRAKEGGFIAKLSQNIVENLDSYLSASQLGITLASLGLGWIGEPIVSRLIIGIATMAGLNIEPGLAHSIALPLAFMVITVMHIVLGELAPKSVAIRFPEITTLALALPLRAFYLLFLPFIIILNGSANILLRCIGLDPDIAHDTHSPEELRILLKHGAETGAIKAPQAELLERVFKFDERIVKQAMVPRTKISAIEVSSSADEIVDKLVREGYSRMPVYKGSLSQIVGIVYAKDLVRVLRKEIRFQLADLMHPPYFVPETKKVSLLLKELQRKKTHMCIVVDEFGDTSGLITLEDIVEELVGEIQDEFDDELPIVQRKSEHEFVVDAAASIIDASKYLPVPLPEGENYDSVAGLINLIFGGIPELNDTRVYGRYAFTVLRRSDRKVESVLLELRPDEEAEEESEEVANS